MTKEETNTVKALWWRLPEEEQEPYRRAMLEKEITNHSIDKLVLKYFIQEGFHSAARVLAKEAGIALEPSDEDQESNPVPFNKPGFNTIVKRKEIKYLILEGNIQQAIQMIGKYFPTILDSQHLLLFSLLRLNLIEMIREHKFLNHYEDPIKEKAFLNKVLDFVRENMINKVTHSASLLKDLETTMSLLCFNFNPSKPLDQLLELPPKLRALFDLSLRRECYRQVNHAILDLNDYSSGIHYCGVSQEFSVSDLQALSEKRLDGEDVDMDNSDDEENLTNAENGNLKLPTFGSKESENVQLPALEETEDNEKSPDKQALRSQLERIAVLWLATERKLQETKKESKEDGFGRTYTALFEGLGE